MKIKNLILTTLLSCVFLIGCKKENDDTLSGTIVDGKITAKVENASKYSNVVEVKLMVYERDTIPTTQGSVTYFSGHYVELARSDWKNGRFTIELPKKLPANYLRWLVFHPEQSRRQFATPEILRP